MCSSRTSEICCRLQIETRRRQLGVVMALAVCRRRVRRWTACKLMTHPAIKAALTDLREDIEGHRGVRVDGEDLRLLDSALWMAAVPSKARNRCAEANVLWVD